MQYSRTALLLGEDAVKNLHAAHVAVFGVGGVGGFAVEALARSGVGTLTLVDNDTVSLSNLNRQIIALHSTLGMEKVDAAMARVKDIDPNITVIPRKCFYLPETADSFDFSQYDYVVDAIDTVTGKLNLAERCQAAGVPMISAMGAGNKLDPTAFVVTDISKTSGCHLARVMRKECVKRGIRKLKVVYSKEEPRKTEPSSEDMEALARDNPGRRSIPGSVAFVPSVMGLILAGEVIKDLTGVR